MAETAVTGRTPRASRLDRRKARTRQALIDAAVRLIAEAILRTFGVPATDASRIAALDLPSIEAW
jgi:AcrR family transcriptional regulator